MKKKRIAFILSLIVLFCVCFFVMNQHYDKLARYQYVSDENREIILKYLNTEDINYMIAQQIKPEEMLPFIEEEGFDIHNTIYYTIANQAREEKPSIIVDFVNEFKGRLHFETLPNLLKAFDYSTLKIFFEEDNEFVKNAKLVSNPMDMGVRIQENETLFTYQPSSLIQLNESQNIPIQKGATIQINQEILPPLQQMCKELTDTFQQPCGNLNLSYGFISYDEQISYYERMIVMYGRDQFSLYGDLPGQSEFQLGNMIHFQYGTNSDNEFIHMLEENIQVDESDNKEENPSLKAKQLYEWLESNVHRFGFILRYPLHSQKIGKKKPQPLTLRYVGKEIASELYEKNIMLEQYQKK